MNQNGMWLNRFGDALSTASHMPCKVSKTAKSGSIANCASGRTPPSDKVVNSMMNPRQSVTNQSIKLPKLSRPNTATLPCLSTIPAMRRVDYKV